VGTTSTAAPRTRTALVVVVAVLAAYNMARTVAIPPAWHLGTNLTVAVVLGAVALGAGLDTTELGLHRAHHPSGARWGFGALALVVVVVGAFGVITSRLGTSDGALDDARLKGPLSDLLFEVLVNTPFGTVVLEEFAFRGVLLALLLRLTTTRRAVVLASLLFGCWHIMPTLTTASGNGALDGLLGLPGGLALVVAGNVLVTGLAGAVFSLLRLRSGSLLAPALAHLATNDASLVVGWLSNHGGVG
jgi:membrane protease YdiL (CAAX protease family)